MVARAYRFQIKIKWGEDREYNTRFQLANGDRRASCILVPFWVGIDFGHIFLHAESILRERVPEETLQQAMSDDNSERSGVASSLVRVFTSSNATTHRQITHGADSELDRILHRWLEDGQKHDQSHCSAIPIVNLAVGVLGFQDREFLHLRCDDSQITLRQFKLKACDATIGM